jgi:hypothetical protein
MQDKPGFVSLKEKPNDHSKPLTSTPAWKTPPSFSGEFSCAKIIFSVCIFS